MNNSIQKLGYVSGQIRAMSELLRLVSLAEGISQAYACAGCEALAFQLKTLAAEIEQTAETLSAETKGQNNG